MPRIELDNLTPNNLGILEKINEVTLPVKFSHDWYKEALEKNGGHLVKYAYFKELPVGAVKARIITEKGHLAPSFVYIDSIAVLEAYRGFGIGTLLLDWLIEETKKIYLHKVKCHGWRLSVGWYEKHGFKEEGIVKDYYKGQENPDAAILVLDC